MAIDPELPIPVYFQLKTLLLEEILEGRYGPDGRLPTEHELCERHGISRTPVTRALSELATEGVVIRHRRRGTFVNPHWLQRHRGGPELRVIVPEGPWEGLIRRAAPADTRLSVATVELHELHQALTHAVAEGLGPDLAVLDSVWVPEFTAAGFLAPLEELDQGWVAGEYEHDFLTPLMLTGRSQGRTFAVHCEADLAGMWYRRAALEALGLGGPRRGRRPPTSCWPEAPPGRAGWGELAAGTWSALPVDPELGLVAGEENPADDPASLPLLLSTQMLRWHTATRLRAHAAELGLEPRPLGEAADTVRAAIRDRFACPGPFGTQWAYETDGRGRHRRYQDANDLPTALAPLWGLCPPDDRQWSATMRFALGPANPGWSPGPWGGLGSAHTPGTWPLGDIQEWVAASLLADTGRAERALERLLAVAAPDGLLPETYDSATGRWLARPWFAWPAATLAALALGAWNPGLSGPSAG